MVFSNNFERRFGWLSFPGFLRYYVILQVLASALILIRPDLPERLAFSWEDVVIRHEWWRCVTCLFCAGYLDPARPEKVIYLVFTVLFSFLISDVLEQTWGKAKSSLFLYLGVLGCIVSNLLGGMGGWVVPESAFFAFATILPRFEIRFQFIIPVQARFIALLYACLSLFPVAKFLLKGHLLVAGLLIFVLLLGYGNYVFLVGIPAGFRLLKRKILGTSKHAGKFKKAIRESAGTALYRCAVCQRTESSDPELEFRVGPDGRDYCTDHIPE